MDESGLNKQITGIAVQIKMMQAEKLLYKGNYKIADTLLLETLSNYGELPGVLNMYAISLAQQKRYPEAEEIWNKALRLQPENVHFRGAINRIHSLREKKFFKPSGLSGWLKLSGAAVIVLLIIWFGSTRIFITPTTHSQSTVQNEPAVKKIESNESVNEAYKQQLSEIENTLKNRITGIEIKKIESALYITFNEGLFRKGCSIKPGKLKSISHLYEALASFKGNVYIMGSTDDLPLKKGSRYLDNTALSIERAGEIYNTFRSMKGKFAGSIFLGALPVTKLPFPNKTLDERKKNRTVVIILTFGEKII